MSILNNPARSTERAASRASNFEHAWLEMLESRVLLSAAVEPINGAGNNVANPTWGAAGTDLLRLATAAYSDGVDSPALASDQSARAISNILNSQANPADPTQDINTLDQNNLSDFGYAFGQFVDHDLDLTPDGTTAFDIPVSSTDPIGPAPLPLTRSVTDPATGTSMANPAQQVTDVTSYLDLSQVYGSDQATADALRTMSGGLLKTSPGNMLPYDNSTYFTPAQLASLNQYLGGMQNQGGVPTSQLFAAGDVRANENLELTALVTLFVRNHNAIAQQLQADHPHWSDQQLYQEARKLNIAEYQGIIYNEWIPAVLGPDALTQYAGYNPDVDAGIATEFSTVAFRFGHSLVSPSIARDANNGTSADSAVPLSLDFFDPTLLNPNGVIDPETGETSTDIGNVLKGEADGNGEADDILAVSDIRNLLFGNYGDGGQDLMALDVQRGRDNGIPDYNTLRVAMGLPAVTSFSQITSNVQVQQELAEAYPGGVNTIDAFEGGLAEDHVAGSDVGPLFQAIIANQFERLRDGDRFFYLNESFTPEEMKILKGGNTLTKVIENNTTITNLQPDAFLFTASIGGVVSTPGGMRDPRNISDAGITVQLLDADGDVLGTTTTDSKGRYSFNQQTGIDGTGEYTVSIEMPAGEKLLSSGNSSMLISRGGVNATMNFMIGSRSSTGGRHGNPPAHHWPGGSWHRPQHRHLGFGSGMTMQTIPSQTSTVFASDNMNMFGDAKFDF